MKEVTDLQPNFCHKKMTKVAVGRLLHVFFLLLIFRVAAKKDRWSCFSEDGSKLTFPRSI